MSIDLGSILYSRVSKIYGPVTRYLEKHYLALSAQNDIDVARSVSSGNGRAYACA
jgi:hypothetical protein